MHKREIKKAIAALLPTDAVPPKTSRSSPLPPKPTESHQHCDPPIPTVTARAGVESRRCPNRLCCESDQEILVPKRIIAATGKVMSMYGGKTYVPTDEERELGVTEFFVSKSTSRVFHSRHDLELFNSD